MDMDTEGAFKGIFRQHWHPVEVNLTQTIVQEGTSQDNTASGVGGAYPTHAMALSAKA